MSSSSGSRRALSILYGGETGTAESVAVRLYRESKRFHFDSRVCAMDAYPTEQIVNETLVVFVCATTGQGDEPENMAKFWKLLLRKKLTSQTLAGMKFGVVGLGDSSYPKYNYVGKKIFRRLLQLGGEALIPLALGDDQHDLGPDAEVDPWIQKFWTKALEAFPLAEGLAPLPAYSRPAARYNVTHVSERPIGPEAPANECGTQSHSELNPFLAPLSLNARQTSADHFQDTRLVEFDVTGSLSGLPYQPGDVCVVMPKNSSENVEAFFELFPELDRKARIWLEKADSFELPNQAFMPQGSTIEYCVENYWDIQSIPRRYFFELLSHFSSDPTEKEKLLEFNTAEGQQDLYDYVNRPRRNILEVLYDFRHTTPNIAFNYLFDLLPPVRPRSFSIASAPSVHGGKVQLLVAVVSFRTQLVKQRLGLCSSFLASCNVGDKVPIWVKKGTFSFPLEEQSPQKPMIMVGPGTGIAPFRSFALERLHLDRNNGGKSDLVVFFGCRNRRGDYYFADEWENMKASEEVDNGFKFFAAFSRDQEDKEYVQHLIEKKADLVREFVQERGGSVYIAGNAKMMPDQVMDEIKKSLAGLEENENEKYVEEMVAKKRLQMETWS